MKRLITLCIGISILFAAKAQETNITVKGGYAFANIEDVEESSSGWRLGGLFEYVPYSTNLSHGFSIGYIGTNSTIEENVGPNSELKANHWPFYYVPKYSFGDKAIRPFVKGALGFHISSYDYGGTLRDIETGDAGFYGGLGAGLNARLGDVMFLNLEYEWAFLSNSWYSNGFVNSLELGLGFRF